MAAYGTVKVKVMIHDAAPNIETAAVGTMARDIKDHIDTFQMRVVGSIVEIVETGLSHQNSLRIHGCVEVCPVEQTLNSMKCH